MALTDNQKWLYQQLTDRKINLGSEEQFAEALKGKDNLQWMYQQAKEQSMDIGDENQFFAAMSSQQSAPRMQQQHSTNFWQSIGAHDPYPQKTAKGVAQAEREQQLQREDTATMPLSQQDKDRQAEIQRLQTEGTWGKPNGFSMNIDKQTHLPVITKTDGDGMHLSTGAAPANQDQIDRLRAEQPSYITRTINTPQDLYTSVSEAWAANTPDGQKAKAELDKTAQDTYNNLMADMNRQITDLQQQVNNGSITQQQAQTEAQRIADNANAIYENKMRLAQGYFFRQMTDANADYLSQQTRLLGQNATNQTIADINARIAPHIRQLETERQQAMQRASQSSQAQGGMYGAIGASISANMAYKPEKDQELALYHQSQQFLADAAKISDAAQKGEGFWKGLGKSLGDIDTWDFGISQLTRSANLKKVVEKYERGEQLTDAEKGLMDSAVAYMSACAYNSDKINRRYKMGQTTGESIPFMLQFMVMPIGAIKDKVAKGVLGYGIEQFGGKAAQAAGKAAAKYGAKTAFKEAGTALLGNLVAAGVQTAAFGVPKIAEGAISRMTGDIQPTITEQGNIAYNGRRNQQSAASAVWNSTVDMYAENLSEMILTSLDPLKAYAGTTKLFQGLKSSQIAQVLGRMNDGVIGKVRDRVQFRNYLEEVGEEYVGNLIRWGLSTDVNNAEDAGFSSDRQIDTWLGLAPTSIAFGAANIVEGGIDRFQSSRAAKRLREIMQDGAQRQYLESLLRSRNSDDFSKNAHEVIKTVLRDKELNEDTKRLIMDGIYSTYQSQLAQEAEQARIQAEAERQAQPEQPETANVSDSAQPQTQAQVQVNTEGEEHYQDADGNEVTFYRNADGSVTLRDKNGNAAVDEQGNAVTLTQTEFDQYARDTNLRRVDRELTPEQWANRENQLRQQYEAEVQPNTHNDGNVYEVALASDGNKHGYIVGDGNVEIDDTADHAAPRITNSDVVTVRYEDGTMEQVAAKDLNLLSVGSANDIVEQKLQPFQQYAQAMQTFRAGQEVTMNDGSGNTYTSHIVSVSTDGVEVEIENAQGEPDTTIIPNEIALTALHPVEQKQPTVDITNPKPIGTNKFGNVYQWVTGKAKEAAQFLRQHKNSYLKGVFHRDDIGDIDLVWGNDKAGLQHIIRRHIEEQTDFDSINEAIEAINNTIQNGRIVSENDSQCTIDDGTHRVAIAKDETGNWIVTAYDNSRGKAEKQRGNTNSPLVVPSTEQNNPSDVAFSHQENGDTSMSKLSTGKGTTNSANTQAPAPNINTMSSAEIGATTVEYMGGDRATAVAYLEAERDKADAEVKRLAKQKVTRYTDIADFKRQNDELQAAKKAAADQYNKLQNAIATANNYKTQAEQAEEAERKAREEEQRATRRQTQTAQLANAAPAERWKAAPKVEGNAVTRTLSDGTVIKGHYILVEAGAATPSHDPFNGWNTSNGFPVTDDGKNINDRDYKNDTDAQQITTQIAQTYDGQAVAQVPVVSSEGIVYDGNGRTIAGNIAAVNNTDGAYIQSLADNAGNFGFAPEQVEGMQHPRVYMQTDEDLPYNTTTFAKFNAQEKKSQGSTNRAVSSSKKLTDAARDGMLRILDNYGTLDAFFASENGAKDIVRSLLDNGIITQQEVAGLTENTDRDFVLSPAGKDYITDLLIGGLFDEQTIRMLGNDKGLKQSILRAMPSIVENRRLGDYALTDNINNAIRLLYEARQAGMAYPLFIKQGNAFDGYVSDRFSPFEMLLVEEMSSGVETFRQVLNLYNNSARNEANGQAGLFEPRTIENIKNEILQHYGKSTDQSAVIAAESTQSRPANTQTEPPAPSAPAGDGQEQIATDIPASNILEQIEAEAEPFEEIELTPANWYALFGEDGIVSTPIGYVKMGEHQYLKLAQKGRDGKLGMIKPTLEHPSVVVMDKSQAKDGQNTEREFSYVFVKAFVGKNGERLYYFTSITVSKDGQEVVISNQEKERSRIQRLLKNGKLAYINKATLPPASDKTIQGDQLTNPVGEELSSADKGTKNIPNSQTPEQKSAENLPNASQGEQSHTEEAPKDEQSKDNGGKEQSQSQQSENKIFTEDAYEAARRRMHERLNRLNAGLDPEMLSDGLIMAGYHVEKGARKFAEFAREMIREFGDKIRPYLKSFYNGLRDLPEAVDLSKEMDDYSTVMQFDVNSISIERKRDEKTSDILPSAGESVTLQSKKVDVDGLFGALNTKGEAKLSDHIEQESLSSANAEDTQPIGNVTQSKHTKTGEDIWIVKPSERVSDDEFKLLKARAKANNGYYSSFAKNRGFIFKSKEDANNFNNISDEEITTDQTSADTETAVRTAETVVGETANITRDRRDSNRAEGEPSTESIEGGVREPRNVELTPEQANEQVTTRQQAIAKIDNANDKITDQLAVLGFYEADTSDPTKLHESYGYIKTAEAKAVKDIDRLAKQLADDLGIKVSKRKTIAKANIAPAGGDISFRLPLENGKELYLSVDIEPNFNNYYRADGDANSLVADNMFWRIEDPQANGTSRYLTPNQNYGLFERGQVTTTYADLLRDIRRMGRDYLSTIPTGTTKQEIAKQIAEKTTRKKKDTTRIADTQSMLDLFGDVAETMNEGAQQEHDEPERKFVNAVSRHLLGALVSEDMQTPFRSILDLRKLAKESGIEVDDNGKTDILLQELVEDGLVRAARQLVASGKYGDAKSKATYDAIVHLYEIQPTIAQRSSNRIAMQQYSTPLPMAFVADMFAYEPNMRSILEPTAGNGMLVFAVPAEKVHANELDETRLANLHLQEFQEVTSQDATEPFGGGKRYDAIIANPPFGSREEREYDGKMIAGLDPQITLNALASMKDSGKAAIIIGGNMEYADNGSVKDKKAFWSYLYDHYNVKGVVDMDGQLYRKQGTTYPTRMILIDGRRSEAEREQTTVYPPIQQKAIAKVNTFDDLYNTIAEITNSNKKTNGTEILRTTGGSSSVSDSNNTSGNTGVLGHSGQHRSNDGDGRDGGQRPTDSAGSAGGNRPNAERGVSTTPRTGGEKVSGHPMGGVLRPQEPVHGFNTTSDDGSSARPERATTDGERSGEDNVGRPGRVPMDGIRELGTPGDRVGLKSQPKRNLTEEKLPYRPHNTAFSLQSVAPAAMVEAMDNTLSQIEKSVGKSIDQFVTDELGYDTIQDAHNALAAEQMDSVAMAIYQMKQGQSLIIGDQTGVGKGRQMAALIRWAVRQGKKPIFVTQKADLFSDIYRDLVDIGSGDLRPFILNSDGAMVDANGGIVHKPLPANIQVRVFENEKLLKDFDYVVLTYSQVNTGDAISQEQMMNGKKVRKSKAIKNNKPTPKATFLRNISKDNYLFLDESHTAAGDSNVGAFFQSIIGTKIDSGVRAVTFASATFAKRPDTMPMYALRTAMAEANIEREELIDIIEKGGVTLQEIMSRALTESGQMVRRERDMSDVRTDWKTIDDPVTTKRAREQYDRTIVAFNAIIDFQDKFITPLVKEQDRELAEVMSTANLKKGTKKFGVDNTPFASKTFNYTKQLMLALKVDAIVDEVEREIKAGRHPVIALESTMESTIKDYTPGETIAEPSFSASLLKGLDNCMQYTIKDDQGVETHMTYTPNELGEEGETAYYKLQDFIRESTKDIFISPLDAIIERLHEKGYRVGELTGRNTYVERTDDGKIVVRRRTDKDKKRMQREFNSGALDVLILNKSASTGISLHASEKFSDQRQRSMIIAQPLSDINDYMQMIGRIDRTGQVHRGYYINLGLPVPAESRFLMMLSTKLKSLNANTTTSQDSESNEVDAPDLLNKYGSQVVIEYLRDNPTIYEKIGEPLKKNSKKGDDKIIHANELDEYTPSEDDALKITGRVALLNTKEQEEFYNDVVRRYNDLIRYLNDTGTNDLKITTLPLRAKTISRKVSSVGREPNGNNPFAGNAYVEQVEMDVLRKPMKANEVQKLIVQLNGTSDRAAGRKRVKDIMSIVERETEDKMTLENERYENAKQKAALTLEEYARKINANEKMSSEQKATTIEQKQQETEQKLADKNRDNILSIQHKAAYLNRMLDMFTVGETYLVPDDLGSAMFSSSTHSIFCGYKVKDNKISASTSFAVFATLDGRRKVEIKLSDISILNRINDHTNQNWDAAQQTTLDNWDKQIPTQTRKEGYIMTGNILQAVADTQDEYGNYTGQLISYTDIDGNIHDGILMPDKWKTSQLRGGVPISARLEQMKQGTVVSTDGKVTIRRGWGAPDVYFLIVPKSKSEGGKYFLNPDILRLVEGNNFYTVRGHMQAEVPAQNIEAVLGILSDMGVKAQDSTIEAQYDELDYDTDNLTDAQQLATDAVLGALDDAGIFVERVSEEEAEREVEKDKSDSNVRLMLQMEQGTLGLSYHPIAGAKIVKNLETAKNNYTNLSNSTKNAISDIAKALGARNTGTSNYITIEAKNGTIFTLRLSNHNATVANFDNNGETNGISIVISRHDDKGITNNGNAHIVEYFYPQMALVKADGTPIADIIGALEQTMYSGEYTDPTGLAQRQEVNIPAEPFRTSNGTIYGYAKDGKIYLTDRGFNPNTPIHEYTHLWVKAVRNNNAELYDNLRDLFSRENLPDMWNELDNDPQYRNLSDEAKLSEIIARFSGKRGAERMEQEAQKLIDDAKQQGKRVLADAISLRERMRNLLRRFWNWVGEHLFRIKNFGSREEAADRVLYDLLNGTDLGQTHTENDSQAEFSTSPMPKRMDGEMVHEWAKRIAEWKRQQVDEQQVAEYAKLLDQNGSKKSNVFAYIVDKFTSIDNFQQWVQAQGGVYNPDTMDMHSDISLALGRIETFSRRYKNDYMQRIADSIAQIAKDNHIADPLLALGLKWQNFDNKKMNGKPLTVREIMGVYAQAKDTWEADRQGLPDRGAQGFVKNLGVSHTDIIEAVERIIPQKQLDEFWNAVYAANQFALDYQLNAGMLDTDTRNRYTRRYYVPQRGWRERDFDGKDTAYIKGNGTRLYGNPYNAALVKAHGRESLASDPFALIESIGLTSITQSEHNKSKQQLLNLLLANEMLGLKSGAWRVKQVWSKNVIDPRTGHIMRKPNGIPIQAEVTYAAPTQQEREHDADINAQIEQLRKELRDLTQPTARAKREAEIANLQDQLIYTGRATDTMLEHRTRDERLQHQIIVLHNGQQYVIELQDERLANAVNGNFGEAVKAYALFNKYNAPAIRYISGMLTQYNPRFAHRNFWRDAQAAFLNNLSEQGVVFTTRAMANIPMVQRTVWRYILADTYKGKEEYTGLLGDYLREYFEAGAQTGFSFMPELERMAKDFDKMVKGENAWDKVWGKGVKGTLSLMTEASELTVRFAEYVTARQMGRSVQEAAKMAKNISVNFNQSGLLSKEMSKFFTFFNATIQGNMRLLMPYGKNKPKFGERAFKFGAKFAGMAADFALLGLFSTFLQPDDPDDDTWFTEYDRMSNFILFGKVKIPVVPFFRMFYAAGVQAALAAQGRKTWKDAFYTSADYALGELVPASALQVQNLWDYDKTTNTIELNTAKYAQAAAPSVISPLVDVAVNRDFKGSTVYRKKWDNDKKDITTAKHNTPQWAVDVSNTLHRWSGGNPDVPYKGGNTDGWIDIKPNAIEHLAQGYLSGAWEGLGHTAGFIWDGAHDADVFKHATNWPFLRDLFRDYSEEKAYNQQYYSVLQKLKNYEKRVNSLSQDEFDAEEQTSRFQTFENVAEQLYYLPNPYNDEEATVTSQDVKDILKLDIQLNRNLFDD